MSIQSTDIVWRKSQVTKTDGSNGGRMTSDIIASDSKNNIWADVPQSERDAGSVKYEKVFLHIANDEDLDLIQPRVFVESQTDGDDAVTIFAGTQINYEAGIVGGEHKYGCGDLNVTVSSGVTSIDVVTEGESLAYFTDGDLIRISDKTDVNDATGNEEYVTISGVPSYLSDVATITFTPALTYGYSAVAGATRVASVMEPADVTTSYSAVSATGGTFDPSGGNLLIDHIGGIYQTWTLTFSNATDYVVTSDDPSLGISEPWDINSTLILSNPDYSKPYFTLLPAAFGGTFVNGSVVTFTTSPASIPVWYKRTIPAGTASLVDNAVIVAVDGQSS